MPTNEAADGHAFDRPRNRSAAPIHGQSVRRKSNLGEKSWRHLPANPEMRKGYKPPVGGDAREGLPIARGKPPGDPRRPPPAWTTGSRMDWLQERLLTAERKLSGVRRALKTNDAILPLTRKQPRRNIKRLALSNLSLPFKSVNALVSGMPMAQV